MVDNNNNINSEVLANMRTHYLGILSAGVRDLGNDFMSKSIFASFDTDKNNELSKEELDAGLSNLDSFIKKSVEKDSFYADIHFGKSYTEASKKTNPNSAKSTSEQIVENNLKDAIAKIYAYAEAHKDNEKIQKIANKLKELEQSGGLKLTDIEDPGIAGRANRDFDTQKDEILIDNHDSMSNLTSEYLLQTLLHEVSHTLEGDRLNSRAEEVEAESVARDLAKKISGKVLFNVSISEFEKAYSILPEASPGTYNIPENAGIVTWYKPAEVKMDDKNNVLIIKSLPQADLDNATIEEQVQYGTEKDANGNPLPISATHLVKNESGEIIYSVDYGEYNKESRSFNNIQVKALHNKHFKTNKFDFGLG